MEIQNNKDQVDSLYPETNESLDYQNVFTMEEEERILKALKKLDEGKKVYHDLIEIE